MKLLFTGNVPRGVFVNKVHRKNENLSVKSCGCMSLCNAKRVAMNGAKRNTLAGGGVDSISQLTIEKAGAVCYDKKD